MIDHPHQGGSYRRAKDGTLERIVETITPAADTQPVPLQEQSAPPKDQPEGEGDTPARGVKKTRKEN
jgi:hypothetical protein